MITNEGWHPMATAPKDGRDVLVWDGLQHVSRWVRSTVGHENRHRWVTDGGCVLQPKLWRPCPPNPQQ